MEDQSPKGAFDPAERKIPRELSPSMLLEREGFAPSVIAALKAVTKTSEEEDYAEFVARAKADPIGARVKAADITDNLDVRRIGELTTKDLTRINKYKAALAQLRD